MYYDSAFWVCHTKTNSSDVQKESHIGKKKIVRWELKIKKKKLKNKNRRKVIKVRKSFFAFVNEFMFHFVVTAFLSLHSWARKNSSRPDFPFRHRFHLVVGFRFGYGMPTESVNESGTCPLTCYETWIWSVISTRLYPGYRGSFHVQPTCREISSDRGTYHEISNGLLGC